MSFGKTVKEVMVRVSKYPHVPYWLEIGQAIKIVKLSFLDANTYYVPMAILILDEKYNLMGTLTLKEILRKIEEAGGSEKILERSVGDIMSPAKIFVQTDDRVTKAASLMIENNLDLLPVLDDKKKFIGLVRLMEIFDELIDCVLKKQSEEL